MPTPVSTARQCLTDEAARSLDEAVAVARRRSHSQTTSLHAVSAFLALPSSALREACSRARSCSYSPRLQFRALELSVGVSLDRLPTTKTPDEQPPISNSLMAAIKRAQANQRRHPDTFHLYNSSVTPSISAVKVELMHFILSILDDPIVSRVFGEAGFRSSDIKLSVLNPPRFSRPRCPPLFLSNLTDTEVINRPFNFPFPGFLGKDNDLNDENSKRIGEILAKKVAKNPLLIGVCAKEALNSFLECVEMGKGGILPDEISGLRVISIEKEIFEVVEKGGGEEMMASKFKELNDIMEGCTGVGMVVNYGDLKVLVEGKDAKGEYVVSGLSRLVKVHADKLRLIGAAASDDTYRKFLHRLPGIDKDWDLQLLPITSSKPSSIGGGYPKSSLMGSFVPFGGFFSLPSELENLRTSRVQSATRCNICNEKYEQEVSAVIKDRSAVAVSGHSAANLPSWLRKAECGTSKAFGSPEAKDDKIASATIMDLQKKWSSICQRCHSSASVEVTEGRSVSGVQNVSPVKDSISRPSSSEVGSYSSAGYLVQVTKRQQLDNGNLCKPTYCNMNLPVDCMSVPSRTPLATDLLFGTHYVSREGPQNSICQEDKDHAQYVPRLVSSGKITEKTSNCIAQSRNFPVSRSEEQYDWGDVKQLRGALAQKVSWQDEAIYIISQTISRCRSGEGRKHGSSKGSIWLGFLGPDKVGKRKIAAALADSRGEKLVSLDLLVRDGINCSNSIFNSNGPEIHDMRFRGKMFVDLIAEQLSKNPHSVILLEDIDNADIQVQYSLSQAVKTGKFPDSHGREINIGDRIFVLASQRVKAYNDPSSGRESFEFPEERILAAKDQEMRIVVTHVAGDSPRTCKSNGIRIRTQALGHKRKMAEIGDFQEKMMFQEPKRLHSESKLCLDLNLPVEEMDEENDSNKCDSCGSDDPSDSKVWLEDLLDQLDENVVFKPFDFDVVSEKIVEDIGTRFQKIVGDGGLLEIDGDVVVQMVAAVWLSDRKNAVEDWVEKVLCSSLVEARRKYHDSGKKTIFRLVSCGDLAKEHAPGIRLPARVTIDD